MKKILTLIRTYYVRSAMVVTVLLTFVFRFVSISYADLLGDGAINSFRAFGWFDWLGISGQSTPFEWLGFIPLWARLSFHDAPPLAFFIQHIFFIVGGDSVAIARLPFVIAGVGSILVVYFFLKKITGPVTACIAMLLYSVVSYSVWAEYSVYLEGIQEFFIASSILFGAYVLFKDPGNKKTLLAWALFTGLALITKYTALFLLPPIVIFIWLYKKTFLVQWKTVLVSFFLFIVIVSPVIVYNLKMYQLRGHFDAAISSMVGMQPDDFKIISNRAPSLNVIGNFPSVFVTLSRNVSYPLLIFFIACLAVLTWRCYSKGLRTFEAWILINMFFLMLMFSFAPAADRFVSIVIPLLILSVASGVSIITEYLAHKRVLMFFFIIMMMGVFIGECIYSLNTNVLSKPVGTPGILYSTNKLTNLGFNQLDEFIRSHVIVKLPVKNSIKTKSDILFGNEHIEGRSVVIFDDRINWFAQMWYAQKYFLFYRWPVISTTYFIQGTANSIDLKQIASISGKSLYFVYPLDPSVMDPARSRDATINSIGPLMAKQFDAMSFPSIIIHNTLGLPVFRIYTVSGL